MRKIILLFGLLVTLYFSFVHRFDADDISQVSSNRSARKPNISISNPKNETPHELLVIKDRSIRFSREEGSYRDLFSVKLVPVISSVPAIQTPPPQSIPESLPALPFKYLGRQTIDGETEVFLAYGERFLNLKKNAMVDGLYQLTEISQSEIRFTYLPMTKVQSLLIPEQE